MGLFGEILLLPLAPVRGVMWTIRQTLDAAEREQANGIRNELRELEQALQRGEISEADFDQREDLLLDRLEELQQGMAEQ